MQFLAPPLDRVSTGMPVPDAGATASTVSSQYARQEPNWRLVRTLYAGTRAMREARDRYLVKHPRELDENFKHRLGKAVLTNITKDAVDACIARPFSKPVELQQDAPDAVWAWVEDMDLKGTTLHDFTREVFSNAIKDGQAHIFVDYMSAPNAQSRADEIAFGARPYFVPVPAGELIAAYVSYSGSRPYISHIRIREFDIQRDPGGYGEEFIERIRVIEAMSPEYPQGRREVWENRLQRGWQKIEDAIYPLPFVPLFTIYAGIPIDFFEIDPPFLDLAYMNVQHWNLSSEYDAALEKCSFSMLAVRPVEGAGSPVESLYKGEGETEARFTVGPDTVLVGDWYYVEPTASGLEQASKRLEVLEQQMRAKAMDPHLVKHPGDVTATETAIGEAKSQANLMAWVLGASLSLSRALTFAARWDGVIGPTDAIAASINTEFAVGFTEADISYILQMHATGNLSRETAWMEMKRRGMLAPTFDPEQELERLLAENPLPELGAPDEAANDDQPPPPEVEDEAA